ncbi:hypothetical protein CEUSTIGMA_g12341.t1 [Chlamydomonas eustigma]|uniref:CRAL-TRIO domain-containing protein n=1 Tax=Chlamydomonas eustigma TaxID=1157962 RepID=A0A250XQ35_9CHLO|nr:hypothetical protein CEUSTIGMA_g12341.t1 [Chlamydomonas eustigma]|eukprot:GAX84920.1 hypothetical protein CEUSTIGMA_g12341.t1 [Chlamydomonas eustigma]
MTGADPSPTGALPPEILESFISNSFNSVTGISNQTSPPGLNLDQDAQFASSASTVSAPLQPAEENTSSSGIAFSRNYTFIPVPTSSNARAYTKWPSSSTSTDCDTEALSKEYKDGIATLTQWLPEQITVAMHENSQSHQRLNTTLTQESGPPAAEASADVDLKFNASQAPCGIPFPTIPGSEVEGALMSPSSPPPAYEESGMYTTVETPPPVPRLLPPQYKHAETYPSLIHTLPQEEEEEQELGRLYMQQLPPNATAVLQASPYTLNTPAPDVYLHDLSGTHHLVSMHSDTTSVVPLNTSTSIPNTVIIHSSEYDDDEASGRETSVLLDLNSSSLAASSLLSSQQLSGSMRRDMMMMSSFMSPSAHSAVMIDDDYATPLGQTKCMGRDVEDEALSHHPLVGLIQYIADQGGLDERQQAALEESMSVGSATAGMPGSRSRSARHTTDLGSAAAHSASSTPVPSPRPHQTSAAGGSFDDVHPNLQSGSVMGGDGVLLDAMTVQHQQDHEVLEKEFFSESSEEGQAGSTGQVALLGLIKSLSKRVRDDGVPVSEVSGLADELYEHLSAVVEMPETFHDEHDEQHNYHKNDDLNQDEYLVAGSDGSPIANPTTSRPPTTTNGSRTTTESACCAAGTQAEILHDGEEGDEGHQAGTAASNNSYNAVTMMPPNAGSETHKQASDEAARTRAYVASLLGLTAEEVVGASDISEDEHTTAAAGYGRYGSYSTAHPGSMVAVASPLVSSHDHVDSQIIDAIGVYQEPPGSTRNYIQQLLAAELEAEQTATARAEFKNDAGSKFAETRRQEGEVGLEALSGPHLVGQLPVPIMRREHDEDDDDDDGVWEDSERGSFRTAAAAAGSERWRIMRSGIGARSAAWSVCSEIMDEAVAEPLEAAGSECSLDMRAIMMRAGDGRVGAEKVNRAEEGGGEEEDRGSRGSFLATDGGEEVPGMPAASSIKDHNEEDTVSEVAAQVQAGSRFRNNRSYTVAPTVASSSHFSVGGDDADSLVSEPVSEAVHEVVPESAVSLVPLAAMGMAESAVPLVPLAAMGMAAVPIPILSTQANAAPSSAEASSTLGGGKRTLNGDLAHGSAAAAAAAAGLGLAGGRAVTAAAMTASQTPYIAAVVPAPKTMETLSADSSNAGGSSALDAGAITAVAVAGGTALAVGGGMMLKSRGKEESHNSVAVKVVSPPTVNITAAAAAAPLATQTGYMSGNVPSTAVQNGTAAAAATTQSMLSAKGTTSHQAPPAGVPSNTTSTIAASPTAPSAALPPLDPAAAAAAAGIKAALTPAAVGASLLPLRAQALSASPSDPLELLSWLRDIEGAGAKAVGLPLGHPAHVLAALAVRSLGPPQPPGTSGSQAEWARAALLSAILLLELPAPSNATAADRARVGTLIGFLKQLLLIGFLKQWAFSPSGPLGRSFAAATAAAASGAPPSEVISAAVAAAKQQTHVPSSSPLQTQQHQVTAPAGTTLTAHGASALRQSSATALTLQGMRPAGAGVVGARSTPAAPAMAGAPTMMRRRPAVLFNGLLYVDGVDSKGRPVIVVNTAAALPSSVGLDDMLSEVMKTLEPYLSQVGMMSQVLTTTLEPYLSQVGMMSLVMTTLEPYLSQVGMMSQVLTTTLEPYLSQVGMMSHVMTTTLEPYLSQVGMMSQVMTTTLEPYLSQVGMMSQVLTTTLEPYLSQVGMMSHVLTTTLEPYLSQVGMMSQVMTTTLEPYLSQVGMMSHVMTTTLEPYLSQPYVLVVVAIALGTISTTVPSSWALGAYRKLARPYRKNVKHLIVVQPSTWAKVMLFLSRPFVSSKATDKVKKVDSIVEISTVTNGEVDVQHLGNAFLSFLQTGNVPPPPRLASITNPSIHTSMT